MAQATKKRIMDGFLELLEQRPLDKISVVDIARSEEHTSELQSRE